MSIRKAPRRRPARLIALAILALSMALGACTPGASSTGPVVDGTSQATPSTEGDTSSAPDAQGPGTRYSQQFLGVFDTVTTVVGYAADEAAFQAYVARIQSQLEHYHALYDTFSPQPDVAGVWRINENAGVAPVAVDPAVLALLEQSLAANERSGGMVNTAFGPVLEIWHRYREAGLETPESAALPSRAELEAANAHTDIARIEIDREAGTVFLPDPEMRLDVGSGAKGLAVELVARDIVAEGMEHVLLSVGGNIVARGFRDGKGEPWRVGIREPSSEDPNAYRLVVSVSDMAVVTSGVYERFYTVDGRRYHHIIHPDTLGPVEHFDSVTIICPDSGLADSLTTALFNMDYEAGLAMIEGIEGAGAVWIRGDEVLISPRAAAWVQEKGAE